MQLKWYSPGGDLISDNDTLFTRNDRMSLLQPLPNIWNIQIKDLKTYDSGSYKCVLNTVPEQVKEVHLKVQVDKHARRRAFGEKCNLFLGDGHGDQQRRGLIAELFVDDTDDDPDEDTTRFRLRPIHLMSNRGDVYDLKVDTTVADNELMDEKKVKFVIEALNRKMGFKRLISCLSDKEIGDWKSISVKIAFVGKAGCGKSSLINALRGLKSDDRGAAPIGTNETTTKIKEYVHPTNSKLSFWDLPGAGTVLFPQKTYLEKVRFEEYDFIILLSDSRFTELDVWLAKAINNRHPKANLFFVRTKVDCDLENISKSRHNPMSVTEQEKELATIAKISDQELKQAGIKDPKIFLVNNNNPDSMDFGKLVDMLIKTVSEIKREALVLSNIILTSDAIQAKIDYLNEHIKIISVAAAVAAVASKRDQKQYFELSALQSELLDYQRQLGIDRESVECIALALNRDSATVIAELNSESDQCLSNFEEFYKRHDTVEFSDWYFLPFIGQRLKLWALQRQCSRVLKELLQKCINDTVKLRNSIRIWKC